MTGYNFKGFSVLVVDDTDYGRSLLGSALKSVGVGHVAMAAGATEAIDYLRATVAGRATFSNPMVDLVISDLDMEEVDGLMLLRWVRRHRESPNRFLPFVLASSSLDKQRIAQAINMGSNELLAKPFAPETVRKVLSALIDRHRLFVRTKTFFGPDRRRKRIDFKTMERRAIDEAGGAGGTEAWHPDNPDIHFYRLPNLLKAKGLAGGMISDEDERTLITANNEFRKYAEDYADWAAGQMALLSREFRKVQDGHQAGTAVDPATLERAMDLIEAVARDMQGQGANFDYPLLSDFAKSLVMVVRGTGPMTAKRLELMKTYVGALDVVVKHHLKGDGGEVGRQLTRSLAEANRKILGTGDGNGAANGAQKALLKA